MSDTKKPGHYNIFTGKSNPGEAVPSSMMKARLAAEAIREAKAEAKKRKQYAEEQADIDGAKSFRNRIRNDNAQIEQDRKYLTEALDKPIGEFNAAYDEKQAFKKGGAVKMSKGGSASSRADGCAQRGKTRGKIL